MELTELFSGRGIDLQASFNRLRTVAAQVGLPLGERHRTYNSRRAQELGKWAEAQGRGDAFRAAVYQAYFVSGTNIARPELLADLAAAVGLSADEALLILRERRHAADVDADWQRARNLRVTAVPTFLYRQRTLVGFTGYAELHKLITG